MPILQVIVGIGAELPRGALLLFLLLLLNNPWQAGSCVSGTCGTYGTCAMRGKWNSLAASESTPAHWLSCQFDSCRRLAASLHVVSLSLQHLPLPLSLSHCCSLSAELLWNAVKWNATALAPSANFVRLWIFRVNLFYLKLVNET